MSTSHQTNQFSANVTGDLRRKVVAKTSSYTLTADDMGKLFTTRGASGAVTFTLPAASTVAGADVVFVNVADQNMIVAGPDEAVVAFNDLTADSVAFQTTSQKIGGGFLMISDGTSWLALPLTSAGTVTVASA